MKNKKGFVLSTYVYMLLVFFLLLLGTMLLVLNNTKLLSNKLKGQSSNTSGLTNTEFSFVLLGDKDIYIRLGSEFKDPGYKIQSSNGDDLKESVKVSSNLDSNMVGTYDINYGVTYNGITKSFVRKVHVLDNKVASYISSLYDVNANDNGLIKDNTANKNIRYQGRSSNVKNYVYFNCKDKDGNDVSYGLEDYDYIGSCEKWRIIGVFDTQKTLNGTKEKRIKIIRYPFSKEMSWDSSIEDINGGYGVNEWSSSDLNVMLNTYYIGTVNSCTYCNANNQSACSNNCTSDVIPLSDVSENMIESVVWSTSAVKEKNKISILEMYNQERGSLFGNSLCTSQDIYCNDTNVRTYNWIGKIGLPYASDYGYASSDLMCASNIVKTSSTCMNNNWMHMKDNDYWTITPLTISTNSYLVWNVSGINNVNGDSSYYPNGVRPTVYLSTGVKVVDGNGTIDNPYKLDL